MVESLAPPIMLVIANPASAYDENLPADQRPSAMADGVPNDAAPLHDPRLDTAAAELLEVVRQGAALTPDLVHFVTRAHGVVESPQFYLTPPPPEVIRRWNARVGTAGELTLVIHVGPVRFTTLPRGFTGEIELQGTLALPYEHPRVTVTGDDGSVMHPAVTVDGTAFRAPITCTGNSISIAIEADVGGPLAIVPITCGTPPDTIRIEPERNLQTTELERRLTALINRERIAAGLPPLRTDRRAMDAAAKYARVMRRANSTSSDLAGSAVTRMADAGRVPPYVDETTLRARDLAQASMRLLNDPIARTQLLAKNATHVGVGVARSSTGELFVAIDYIQILPEIDTAALEARVTRQILQRHDFQRTAAQASTLTKNRMLQSGGDAFAPGPPRADHELQHHARHYARLLATGWSSATIEDNIALTLPARTLLSQQAERRRFLRVDWKLAEVTDPADLDEEHLLPPGAVVDAIGVGVAQSARDAALSGRVFLVILYLRYRE